VTTIIVAAGHANSADVRLTAFDAVEIHHAAITLAELVDRILMAGNAGPHSMVGGAP
jgi:hypothetical protein